MKTLMGIDMGGTMVKASLFDLEGRELASYGEKLITHQPRAGWMERDLPDAEQKIYRCIRNVLAQSGVAGGDVLGIGVTGQGNGAFFFDAQGDPVCDGVMSSDLRAKEYIRKWYQNGVFEQVYEYTRQALWAGNISALIAWFQDHDPEVLERTAYIVTAKDYVRYLLTGEFHTEMSEGSGVSCMDLTTRAYSPEVFRILGIEKHIGKLPSPIESSAVGGYVTDKAAALTGLKAGTPVVGGQFDVGASIVSAGVVEEGQMGVVVGSWGINSFLSRQLVEDPDIFMQLLYAVPECYNIMEGSATSASNQEWFIDAFMTRDENVYRRCGEMVESTPYKDTLLFFPYLYGSNVNIDAKAMFIGLTGNHTAAHMLRAVYEGVVFCHLLHIEKLLRHTALPASIRMAGGATRSAVWMQLFADILGVDVEVSKATELGTMGVALNAAIAAGVFADMHEGVAKWAEVKRAYHPDPEKTAYYRKKYAAFKAVLTAMDGVWHDIELLKE